MKIWIFIFLLCFGSYAFAQAERVFTEAEIKLLQSPGALVEGSAAAKGAIVTVFLDKEFLKSKLPKNLELQSLEGVPKNLHPVGLFIGKHFGLKAIINRKFEIPIKDEYTEMTFGISSVRIKGSSSMQTYTYISDLRLDSWRAIVMGWIYGFPKKHGHFTWTQTTLNGTESDGSPLISFEMNKVENYNQEAFAANLAFLKANLKPLIVNLNGKLKCIDFDWNFEQAKILPAKTSFSLFDSFIKTNITDIQTIGLDESPFGSIYIETAWKMSSPHLCQ